MGAATPTGLKGLGLEQAFRFENIQKDIARAKAATSKAAVKGSPTAQNIAAQNEMFQAVDSAPTANLLGHYGF